MNYLHILALLVLAVVASGCAMQESPDPEVVSSEQRQGLLEAAQGQATIEADVRNRGGPGNVTATAEILDENDTVLDRQSQEFDMQANETRRIQIQIDVPEGAERYNLSVDASG